MSDRIDWWFIHTSADVWAAWGQWFGGVGTWFGGFATIATVVVMLRQGRRTRRPEQPVRRLGKVRPMHRGKPGVSIVQSASASYFQLGVANTSGKPISDVMVEFGKPRVLLLRYRDTSGRAWMRVRRSNHLAW